MLLLATREEYTTHRDLESHVRKNASQAYIVKV